MRNVIVLVEALNETDDAVEWYEECEPGLGLRFFHDLEVLYASIARRPEYHRKVQSGFRRALMRQFPYSVFYEFDENTVVIHSVFHCARNPEIWRSRLKRSKKKL